MRENARLILASRSPRRRELLSCLGVDFEVLPADLDEARSPGEPPGDYVSRLAREKSAAGCREAGRVAEGASGRPFAVIGSDTAVALGDHVFGKPAGRDEALAQLAALSGRSHTVLTAVTLGYGGAGRDLEYRHRLSVSRVWFRNLDAGEIRAYWATGEPADKAGSYAIQGLAARFVRRIDGSHSAIVGLPLYETAELLGDCPLFHL